MVLGVKTKARKGTSIQLNYLIHIQEIKPWPPSHSLRSLRAAQIQWENGEKSTGSTKSVIPSTGNGVNEGKIEFNESFKLPVTLLRNMSAKAGDADVFQKNCLEFSLYEPRRDKTQKGQLLGTAIIDLADYGVIRDSLTITVQVHCQRNYKNTAQPLLYVTIQPVEKSRNGTSLRNSLSKEASLDKNGGESVLALMKEEYAEEAESNTFSDDDVSSDSSMAVSSDSSSGLPPKHEQKESNFATDKGRGDQGQNLTSETGIKDPDAIPSIASRDGAVVCSSRSSSIDLSYDLGSPEDGHASSSSSPRSSSISVHNAVAHSAHSSLSSLANGQRDEGPNAIVTTDQKSSSTDFTNVEMEEGGRVSVINGNCPNENGKTSDGKSSCYMGEQQHVGTDPVTRVSTDTTSEQGLQGIDLCSPCRSSLAPKDNTPPSERLRHVKSVRSTSDSARSNGTISSPLTDEVKESDFSGDSKVGSSLIRRNERKDAKFYARDTRSTLLEAKVQQMERKIQMLEGELREVAAVEVALYSVVAEHGSSMSKVHAPARRLSRLYLHACREHSLSRRASAARSAVSGLVLVSKACGNDVPRLMYWLSNCVVLRSTISQAMANTDLSISPIAQNVGIMKENARLSALKWESSPSEKRSKCSRTLDWEDPQTFISALEKVEAWIFSRTVESIWWQTLTPHMQCAKAKTIDKGTPASSKSNKRINHVDDQGQGNIAMDLWKKAFKDACERLCPVRAGGHECGCLPMLARLIMEQCVSRLDVAMFNAILRESADDIPTDPVSDPISDSRVLPIPAGKSSFGAGAQLKNAIGNWSRWLTDLFGMDDDLAEDENEIADDDDDDRQDSSFKSFHLLNALSDLMMLPKDMLLSKSIRKEVCPAFGVSLIQRVLNTFVPDEFCPDPIPGVVFEALESQDPLDDGVDSVTSYPYIASPPVYIPPLPSSVAGIIGEIGTQNQLQRSGSSVLRKSYTSDDELDELNSPLALILIDGSRSSPVTAKPGWISKDSGSPQHALRFDLLRDIWLNSE